MTKRRVLVVGWDAADWKVARPLMAAGEMPNLARLVSGGAAGNLATISPPLSPMLWTSIATGKRPTKHGIHGFSEPAPQGNGVRPITTLGRKTKAIWNILHQNGRKPSVVGWWPSHPAEPIRGVMVSNHFHEITNPQAPGPLPLGVIHPPNWFERLSELRTVPMDIPGEMLRLFVPEYDKVDQAKDKRLHTLAKVLAEAMSIHAAATEILEHADWDFAGVYYDAIDHFCHGFMKYHPPRLPHIDEESFSIFSGVIANAYRYHDAMLGRLLQLAGPETTVILLSDHGFHPDALRPKYIPAEAAGPAVEHREFGMIALHGPGIRAGQTIYGANLLDVTPTILHLFGLPVGQDMDGKVLSAAFETVGKIETIESWDAVAGDAGTHPPHTQVDAVASSEAMKHLVALGYVAPPGDDIAKAVADTVTELNYNLARAHADAGEWQASASLFAELRAGDPSDHRFVNGAITALLATENRVAARQMLEDFDRLVTATAPEATAELERRREERADSDLDLTNERKDERELFERRKLAERSTGFSLLRMNLRLRIGLAEGNHDDVLRDLKNLDAVYSNAVDFAPAMFLARSYNQLNEDQRALWWIDQALHRDAENWQALALAARIHLRNRRFGAATDSALMSLALISSQPTTHFVLGRSLLSQGDDKNAEQAFKAALNQMPGLIPAHKALARIYRKRGQTVSAQYHDVQAMELSLAKKAKPPEKGPQVKLPTPVVVPFVDRLGTVSPDPTRDITIVAGLPRSGTSMLMQMLAAGGIAPLTDGLRLPDSDNPRGYWEYEPATRLSQDQNWLAEARGKVVKIALPLLSYLPRGENYRIVIIERDPAEVIASQRVMIERLGRVGGSLDDEALAKEYRRQRATIVRWLDARPDVAVLALQYNAVLAGAAATAERIGSFLSVPFDSVAASASVDPSLRRQKVRDGG